MREAATGARPVRDYRRLLDDKTLDAVIVATPDHWHARMVIDAVEAGKDVSVEKPMAHKIDEGFAIIEAVRRTRRIVRWTRCVFSTGITSGTTQVVCWWDRRRTLSIAFSGS